MQEMARVILYLACQTLRRLSVSIQFTALSIDGVRRKSASPIMSSFDETNKWKINNGVCVKIKLIIQNCSMYPHIQIYVIMAREGVRESDTTHFPVKGKGMTEAFII